MKKYIYNCGHCSTQCLHKRYKKHNEEGKNGHYYQCPICRNGVVMAVKCYCSSCNKLIGIFSLYNKRRVCDDCKIIVKAARGERHNRSRNAKYKQKKENGINDNNERKKKRIKKAIRKVDCIWYVSKCLPKAAFKDKILDCGMCNHYQNDCSILDYYKIPEVVS